MNLRKLYRPALAPIRNRLRKLRARDPNKSLVDTEFYKQPDYFQKLLFREEATLRATYGISKGEDAPDAEIIDRVIAAYNLGTASKVRATAIWEHIYNSRQLPLHQILIGDDRPAIECLLRDPASSDLFYGFDGTTKEFAVVDETTRKRAHRYTAIVQDHLLQAAEIIGALRCESMEMGAPTYGQMPTDKILDALDSYFGMRLPYPTPYPGEQGAMTSRGVVSYRPIHAIYQAWRVRELVKGIANPRILEIGGGLGRTAFYAWQLGLKDYTIIDLPFTGVSQGYFLMRTLGEENVALQGEAAATDNVKILQPSAFLDIDDRYDLIINVDSMTEIDRATADEYWCHIRRRTPAFLSINHEANTFTVRDLALADGGGDIGQQRYPYGLRKGYIEETYSFGGL